MNDHPVRSDGQPSGRPARASAGALDPRLSLLATLFFIVIISSLPIGSWSMMASGAALVMAVIAATRVSPARLLARSLVVLPIAAVAASSILFTRPGDELFSLPLFGGRIAATREGAVAALTLVAKSYLSVLMSAVLVAYSGFPRIIDAMRALRVPDVLTQTIAFAYRYLHVLLAEGRRMLTARESRSVGGGRTVLWRAGVLGRMIGTLFIRSLSRSERIFFAMQARGFCGETLALSTIRWTMRDTALGLLWFVLLVAIALAGRMLNG